MSDLKPCPTCGALPCDQATTATHAAEPAPVAVEPVRWQRFNATHDVWLEVSEDDLDHYRRQGQKLRPLYAHPPRADLAPTGNTALVEAHEVLREVRRHVVENLERMYGKDSAHHFGEIRRIDAALTSREAVLQPAAPQPTPEVDALRQALRNIAEGNLGDQPWQANYGRIRDVARAALARGSVAEKGERDDG